MGVGRQRRRQGGRVPPWIFIHGTDIIVDRGLIVLFSVFFFIFRFFFHCSPRRGLIVLFFGLFYIALPSGKFSANALGSGTSPNEYLYFWAHIFGTELLPPTSFTKWEFESKFYSYVLPDSNIIFTITFLICFSFSTN